MSDDDWFESAFEDEDATGSASEDGDASADFSEDIDTTADAFEDSTTQDAFGADRPDEAVADSTDAFADADTDEDVPADDDPFGSDDDPFASEESGAGGSLFDDDFASAMQSAGPGGDEAGEDFDEAAFESEIPRIDLGISGLDEMIQGGVPERHLMVVVGAPGSGKTTFGLQFLYHGLQQGDSAVFITLEQSRQAILDTANERGWEFDRYEAEDDLAIVDLDPVEMANSLDNIRGELPQLIREFDAERLVLDSVSLLEMMYDDQAKRRTEVFDFTRSLKQAGVTTMLTSEASEDNPYASRHGIIEYLTDAVFVLQYVRGDTQETRLAVEIQKIRNANHSRATKPYDITLDGIDVYQQASIF
ncbi:KaiC domain-containing protein [Halapricum desulfuricans]|uniref:RecA-superfamily ATPase implicated in signal transduction n=1 Tax=Halapricum desulfuricans TaxID=2841257 RepID=A0A897NBE0_9EURY|nr:KaiC domain-containing protein [Halapricum desulfuricans]QSG08309.1 RecA-superfamily ATPase implicated in signal transduction [Halapricum desulfuricans]QSG12576.1 RecA-superfamily ATPase implicated in signal transduction [Halapricum desulfuricans]